MSSLDNVKVDIRVDIGSTMMPIRQLLKLGRGAIVPLDATPESLVTLIANNEPIARGEVFQNDQTVSVRVTQRLPRRSDRS